MTHAYGENYLEHARENFACMLDFARYDLNYPLDEYYSWFLHSEYSDLFSNGNCSVIAGKSGIELAMDVYYDAHRSYPQIDLHNRTLRFDRSPEYWAGWALSYYQWESNLTFRQIDNYIKIDEICEMYPVYHEMDIQHFSDYLNERTHDVIRESRLRQIRRLAGYSQRILSEYSNVPLRTIQQYEQRQKNINKASAEYVFRLSRALGCKMEDIMEDIRENE